MTDEEFLRALECCELSECDFGHSAHVRAAYLYLGQTEFAEALQRVRRAIRDYARHLGKPDRYHETITVAYVALIQQHICERGRGSGWEEFAQDNPALFEPGLLRQFYPDGQLDSAMARRIFLLPRSALPGRTACE